MGTGNWDVNVMIKCLQQNGIECEWFNAHKIKELDLQKMDTNSHDFVGFVLNILQKVAFKMVTRRHWLSIKPINGIYYNLDSKLKKPKQYSNDDVLKNDLVMHLQQNDGQL